jgi:hypothetical protein
MNTEDQITALLAEAAPLRLLDDEAAEAAGLPALVDRINALRAQSVVAWMPPELDPQAAAMNMQIAQQPAELPKRRPGRPRTVVEGQDA